MSREFKFRLWSKSEKCFVNPNILEVWDKSGNMKYNLPTENQTPRTDTAEYESIDEPVVKLGMVDVDFARQLERELNETKHELNEANETIRLQHELIKTAEQQGADKMRVELTTTNERIRRLEAELVARCDYAENRYLAEQKDGDEISTASTRATFLAFRAALDLFKIKGF